jgi:hypothetical protein
MKKKSLITISVFLLSILFISSSCKKTNTEPDPVPVTPIEQLPAITQTGSNSFGCLLNGNVWIPKGNDGNVANASLTIDATSLNGNFTMVTYRIYDSFKDRITIVSDSIKNVGTYYIKTNSRAKFIFGKYKSDGSSYYCELDNSNIGGNPTNINGFIKITRYDLINKIFSGEFEISFNNTACFLGDPIKITSGRFDYKL